MDKSRYVGAPSVEEVAIYCKESGYTIDPVAFVKWNSERGWMNGKKYIALDWRKAVRKWFCKENGLSYSEMDSQRNGPRYEEHLRRLHPRRRCCYSGNRSAI